MNCSPAFGNNTLLLPYFVNRYSTFAVQFGANAYSTPPPAAQPSRHRNGELIVVSSASCVSVSWS